jgi:UDP-N-acetylglucosamine diphosphorylase/glucosamine-1-phosphate N-acetyltransferase
MQICFFTDQHSDNLLPLILTRPVDDLRIGIFTIREKWLHHLGIKLFTRLCPDYISKLFEAGEPDSKTETIWINSQYLPNNDLVVRVENLDLGEALIDSERVVAARIDPIRSSEMFAGGVFNSTGLTATPLDFDVVSVTYFWDMLSANAQEIENDINLTYLMDIQQSDIPDHITSDDPDHIYLSDGATIEPGCIILTKGGPVFIGPDATIEAGSILRGPLAVCEGATVKMGSRISEATTIGPVCKVGGEIINSIFHSYSNKAHDGFVGNSLFGQWCNLGADTNTSNLKNNYAEVNLLDWKTKTPSEKGVQFFGTVMGDHSKTAINTQLNTGTVCGVCSNIVTPKFPPKYISSFAWMTGTGVKTYRLDKAYEAMQAMMQRRGVSLTSAYRSMIEHLFIKEVQ